MTAIKVCPGSDTVPSWDSVQRNRRFQEGMRCPVCGHQVTASPNAAGVVRIDEHDAVGAPWPSA